jgi:hypothetical protein
VAFIGWGCGGSPPPSPTQPTPPTATPPPVTTVSSVFVSGSAPSIGNTAEFTATATLSNSTTLSVTTQATWSSSNTAVATVSSVGVVTAIGSGTVDIIATYQSVSGRAHITVGADWPPEIAAVLNRGLLVPSGLYLVFSLDLPVTGVGCPGGKTPGVYDPTLRRVQIYRDWGECYGGTYKEMLFWTAHEICHAHQHRMLLDSTLPEDLSKWVETAEGQAFMAAGGRSKLPSNPAHSPTEDFANICSAWYMNRDYLRRHDPAMYAFAQAWLPQ